MSHSNPNFYSPGYGYFGGQGPVTNSPFQSYPGGHGYYSTPRRTPSRNNGDPSITSSIPSTFGGGNTPITVTLGQAVREGTNTIDFNVIVTAKKQVDEEHVKEIFGGSYPSKEAIDSTFPNDYKSKYLNDLGEEVYHQSRTCSEGEKWDKISTLKRDTAFYRSILEPVVKECNDFIERNEQYLAQIATHGDPQLLETAQARMNEVKLLASDLSRKQDSSKKFCAWLMCRMKGEPQDIQATLQVVQEIHQSFTFPGTVTIQSWLEQLLKDEFVLLRKQLGNFASRVFQEMNEVFATLQGFYTPFKIHDSALDKETLRSFYFLLYAEVQGAPINFPGLLKHAREKGLLHNDVTQMCKVDHRSRVEHFEWYKYFVFIVFGFYKELELILAKSSLNGKKAVLAYLEEAKKGNWIVLIDAAEEEIASKFKNMNMQE